MLPPFVEAALEERFLAATGPGGQNVNKVATAVQLRVALGALRLPPPVLHRLRTIAGSRITADGELLITARRFRTQDGNRTDARQRLEAMLRAAHVRPERRIATRPSKAARVERVETKSRRGAVKRARARPPMD